MTDSKLLEGIYECSVCGKQVVTPFRTDSEYHYKHTLNGRQYIFCGYTCTRAWQRQHYRNDQRAKKKEKDVTNPDCICKRCKGETDQYHMLCIECQNKQTEKMRKIRNEREAAGLCKICGKTKTNGRKMCEQCRRKRRKE